MHDNYEGAFDSWDDVKREFQTDCPEPNEVLLARYSCESYEGEAYVVFRNGDKYYTVSGSHCSCYGLEGQFEPEEYTRDLFIGMLKRQLENYPNNGEVKRLLRMVVSPKEELETAQNKLKRILEIINE